MASGWITVHGFQYGRGDVIQVLFFQFVPGYVAVIAIVSDHLLSLVWGMGSHGCQPFQGIEDLFLLSVFRPIEKAAFLVPNNDRDSKTVEDPVSRDWYARTYKKIITLSYMMIFCVC